MDYGKLLNLLNVYETTLDPNVQIERTENGVKATPLIVISNEYGFIKWLVENDKIDRGDNMLGIEWNILDNYGYENGLLMLLSISDTPIEDLLSYLK